MTLKKQCQLLKSDKVLFSIFLIHILLSFFHFAYSFYTLKPQLQSYTRAGFCLGIAMATFLFLRRGFSITILLYSCVLLYFNSFFNYTSFLFVLFAIYCTPKLEKIAIIFYALAVFVIFAFKDHSILTLGIHGLNCFLFYTCAKYLFSAHTPETLILTDDERLVLHELSTGKLQKQIQAFSQNTVTKHLKNAMERNLCKTKTELLHKFINENPKNTLNESQTDCD